MIKLILFIWSVGNQVLRAFVITVLWKYFVVETFSQMPKINLFEALGLSLLFSCFSLSKPIELKDFLILDEMNKLSENEKSFNERIFYTLIYVLALFLGYFYHWLNMVNL